MRARAVSGRRRQDAEASVIIHGVARTGGVASAPGFRGLPSRAIQRREKVLIGAVLVGLLGVAGLLGSMAWLLWKESVASETDYAGGLAATLGERTERIMRLIEVEA